jgi:membrane-associated phospholipid phosphatase
MAWRLHLPTIIRLVQFARALRRAACFGAIVAGLLAASPVVAAPAAPAARGTAPAEAATATPKHRLEWRYPRVRPWQIASSAGFTLGAIGIELIAGDAADHGWDNGVLFDDAVRNELRARTPAGRSRAADFSDVSWPVVQWYPVVVDSFLVPLVFDDANWDVIGQMELVNWQVMATVGFATRLTQYAVGRARPALGECAKDPNYSKVCSPDYHGQTASFLSGHTSLPFALAAAGCSHHMALELYGSVAADVTACAVLFAGAATTGMLRLVADQHWATDVVGGALLGTGLGYAIPWGLHYARSMTPGLPENVVVAPFGDSERLGLAMSMVW